MTPLTPKQREYKEETLNQLLVNLPLLEAKLGQESRSDIANNIRNQLDDIRAHIDLLQNELATNTTGEPVADELFQRAAGALTKKKFYLAKKLINKLETIEPFFPGIERLRQEAEAGRASRRTQAIAQGTRHPSDVATRSPETGQEKTTTQSSPSGEDTPQFITEEPEKKGLAQFFQFHIIISCLVVLLILCAMSSVGGIMLLQWLIEG